jgi:hypothetical protein
MSYSLIDKIKDHAYKMGGMSGNSIYEVWHYDAESPQ